MNSVSSQHRRSHYRSPPTPPDDEDHAHHAPVIVEFFKPFTTLTPPPSLPTSPPDSPTRSVKKAKLRSRSSTSESNGTGKSGGVVAGAHSTTTTKTAGSPSMRATAGDPRAAIAAIGSPRRGETVLRVDIPGSEDASIPAGYQVEPTSPILPKVKLAFPTIMSDDEEDNWGRQSPQYSFSSLREGGNAGGVAEGKPNTNANLDHRRSWSQTTKTTRTERRSWRYSLPSAPSVDQYRPDSLSSAATSQFATSSKVPSSEANHPAKGIPRRSHSLRERERRSSPANAFPSTRNYPRSDSLKGSRPSTPTNRAKRPTSASFSSSSTPSIFNTSSTTLPSSSTNVSTRTAPPTKASTPAIVSSIPSATLPLIKPFMNIFLLLSIVTLFFTSISVFLLFGLTLTFYDDCEKKLAIVWRGVEEGQKRMRGSLEGVRDGVGKMLGGARGALEIVVVGAKRIHLSSATTPAGKIFPGEAGSARNTESINEDGVSESPGMNKGGSYLRGRSRTRRRKSLSRVRSHQVSEQSIRAHERPSSPSRHLDDWVSDEDALPFDVPNSTPRDSRTSSPQRRPPSHSPHSHPHTRSNGKGQSHHPTLPPRPPLVYLIPSIVLALLYTAWKIARGLWNIGGAERKA